MKYTVIALVAENMDPLFKGIKEFPTEEIVLIASKEMVDKAFEVKNEMQKFSIPVKIKEMEGNIWLECFRIVAETKKFAKEDNLLINVATSDCTLGCALTSAAFVNGIKAFTFMKDEVFFLPILKFSYYKMLTDKKMDILNVLYKEPECCTTMESLGKKLKMSLPLVSYHINGTMKSDGLKKLGLVDTHEKGGKIEIKLNTMGRLLVKGYIV